MKPTNRPRDHFPDERDTVRALHDALGLTVTVYENPKAKHGRETGADVSFERDGRTFGVQVTQIDGGNPDLRRGALRSAEKRFARSPADVYGLFANRDPVGAIADAVLGKIETATNCTFAEFDEVSLLVSGNRGDAPAATFLLPALIELAKLGAVTHAPLTASAYAEVFLHLHIGGALYRWSRPNAWETVIEPTDWGQPSGYDFWSIQKMLRREEKPRQ